MKTIHVIIILLVVIAIAVVVTTFSDSGTYVSFNTASANPDQTYHVIGTLNQEKPLLYDPMENPNEFMFYMLDEDGDERKILYHDAKTQDFEKSEQVVIIGSMLNDSVFEAKSLLLKCPSKYNEENTPQSFGEQSFESEE